MKLRPYQAEGVEASLSYFGNGGTRGVVVAPTGSGKSHMIAEIGRRLDGDAVVFQPSREILEQNAAKLTAAGCAPAIHSASLGRREVGRVTWAAVVDLVGLVRTFGKIEDLELRPGGVSGKKWAVWSGRRQLTNVYMEAP